MNIKAVRGTKDIYGEDSKKFEFVIDKAKEVFKKFDFKLIITPTFEETALFNRGIGEGTDIVEKEMYSFTDRGGRNITLRPEGTASIVRSYIENQMFGKEEMSKFYYYGQMFRYERPQAGRYREFYQVGAEAMGSNSPILDAEIIYMGYKFLEELGIKEIEVQLNSVGCKNCRVIYRDKLKEFLKEKYDKLCSDCKVRYEKNPLRVLDCKVESCKNELKDAPKITDYLDESCRNHFEEVKKYLKIFKVPFTENTKLVRGLDYYTNTVFEIVTNKLGSQGTVLAGGRYNNLIEEVGGKDVPAIGFAAGVERVMMLTEDYNKEKNPEIFIAWMGEAVKDYSFDLKRHLIENNVKVYIEFEEKTLKSQMKKASKLGVEYILIIGEEEKESGKIAMKNLETGEQVKINLNEVIEKLKK